VPTPPETDLARIARYCEAKVPAHLRDEARVEMGVRGGSVTIFDCRPPWHEKLTEWSKVPVAQLRYDEATHTWLLYFADRNSRWHRYDDLGPCSVAEALKEIDADPTGIFWG
jgi:DUF3024 family protein